MVTVVITFLVNTIWKTGVPMNEIHEKTKCKYCNKYDYNGGR